jgi:apolipoprotein D and lipocalin family protein
MKKTISALLISLCGCAQIPEGVAPVKGFHVQRYLGTWYEIARLDHPFERGLINVTATYSLNTDGSIAVLNRGFDPNRNQWRQAKGRGYFVSTPDVARLKVSFFGPFYGGYNIIDLDDNYAYALVCGNNRSYLWILARTPQLPEAVTTRLIQKAKDLGFDTDALILVKQQAL